MDDRLAKRLVSDELWAVVEPLLLRFRSRRQGGGTAPLDDRAAANTHDSQALRRLVMGIPAIRSRGGPRRRRPDKLRADKGYDFDSHRAWLRSRGITPRIARRGIDTGEHLGRYRWKIERTIAWLSGYRRLTLRYERHADHFAAFLCLAAPLTCWKKLTT
jgi:transposase